MNNIVLRRIYRLHCSHHLEAHRGKCKNIHGHTYKVELSIMGPINPDTNMLMDTGDVDEIWTKIIHNKHDHKNLNDTLVCDNPTMEYMAMIFYRVLRPFIPGLIAVDIWETESAHAVYAPEIVEG